MFTGWRFDLKMSLAFFLDIGGLLASALLVQQHYPENTYVLPLLVATLFATFLLGFWGWGAFSAILTGLAIHQGLGFLALSVFSFLLSCLTLLLIGREKRDHIHHEEDLFYEQLAEHLKNAPSAVPQVVNSEQPSEPVFIDEGSSWKSSYRELHKQFREKSDILHQTRKELFSLEGLCISQQKEQEEESFEKNPALSIWQKEVDVLLHEKEALFRENQLLQEIITGTLDKKARPLKPFLYGESDLFLLPSLEKVK